MTSEAPAASQRDPSPQPRVTVFGGAVADIVSKPSPGSTLRPGTSTPGETRQSFGGVGRNVAEGVARVLDARRSERALSDDQLRTGVDRTSVTLVSTVGADDAGKALVASCEDFGVNAAATVEMGYPGQARAGGGDEAGTASYVAVLGGDGDLVAAVADMRIFERMTAVRGILGVATPPLDPNNVF